MTLLLVRHAWAGDRKTWEGDDRLRPLDQRGREQAARLVDVLAAFPVEAIISSPYLRCAETVAPLAAARGLQVELRSELGEDEQMDAGIELVRSLAGRPVVICGHGGLQHALPDPPKWKKGATLVVDEELSVVKKLRA